MDIQSEIIRKLAGATSDHLPIYTRVEFTPPPMGFFDFIEKPALTVIGASCNQMYQCTSIENHRARDPDAKQHYANNPFNYSEAKEEWRARKLTQLHDEIIPDIKIKKLDFYFLQECDWIYDKNLRQQYESELSQLGFAMIQTDQQDNCQPLVTLYDTKTLKPTTDPKSILFNNKAGKGRAFEKVFTHIPTGYRLALANLHLEFGRFYNDEILRHQYELISKDIYGIAGGDVNNEQNISFIGATGNYQTPTNISNIPGDTHSIEATRRDVFFVNPTSNTAARAITQLPGRVFSMDDQTIFDPHIELPVFDPSSQVLILQGKRAVPSAPTVDRQPYSTNKSFMSHPYMRRQGIFAMHYMLTMNDRLIAHGGDAFVNRISTCLEMSKVIEVLQSEVQTPLTAELLQTATKYSQISIHDHKTIEALAEQLKRGKYAPSGSCNVM